MLADLILRLFDRVLDKALSPKTKRQRTIEAALPELRRRRDRARSRAEAFDAHTADEDVYLFLDKMVKEYERELER